MRKGTAMGSFSRIWGQEVPPRLGSSAALRRRVSDGCALRQAYAAGSLVRFLSGHRTSGACRNISAQVLACCHGVIRVIISRSWYKLGISGCHGPWMETRLVQTACSKFQVYLFICLSCVSFAHQSSVAWPEVPPETHAFCMSDPRSISPADLVSDLYASATRFFLPFLKSPRI